MLYCSFLRDECIIACSAWITDNKIILIAQGLECSKLYLWSRPSCPRWTRHWIVSSCNWWLRPHDEYWSTLDILRHQHWKIGQQSHWHQCSSSAHMCTGLIMKIKGWPRKIMLTDPEHNWNVHTNVDEVIETEWLTLGSLPKKLYILWQSVNFNCHLPILPN